MQRPSGFSLFDHDRFTGVTTWYRKRGNQREFAYTQDVEHILDANKAERYNAKGKACERDRMGFRVARIPVILQLKWLTEEGWDCLSPDPACQAKLREKLNDPEYRHLRCAELVV